jgi:hypothetical protein
MDVFLPVTVQFRAEIIDGNKQNIGPFSSKALNVEEQKEQYEQSVHGYQSSLFGSAVRSVSQ